MNRAWCHALGVFREEDGGQWWLGWGMVPACSIMKKEDGGQWWIG